jgi:hypothetical protein
MISHQRIDVWKDLFAENDREKVVLDNHVYVAWQDFDSVDGFC